MEQLKQSWIQKTVAESQVFFSTGNSYFFIKFSGLIQSILQAHRSNVGLENSTSPTDAFNHSYPPLCGFNWHTLPNLRSAVITCTHTHTHTHTHTRLSPPDCTVFFSVSVYRTNNKPWAFPRCSRTRSSFFWNSVEKLHVLSPSAQTFWGHDVTSPAGSHAVRSKGAMLQHLCPPQILCGSEWNWTQASAVSCLVFR